MRKTLLLAMVAAAACQADIVYDNTTTDQGFSIAYLIGYSEIGDQLRLTSGAQVSRAMAQFFNEGSDATFDATLRFYQVGSPVGTQIGGAYTVTGIFAGSFASQTVTFGNLGGLLLPQDVIAMLSVSNVSSGGVIGVNLYDPPARGASDNTFFVVNGESGYAAPSTFFDVDNIYFRLETNAVPEPTALPVLTLSLGAVALVSRRCRGGRRPVA